jgi:hypothetical protein
MTHSRRCGWRPSSCRVFYPELFLVMLLLVSAFLSLLLHRKLGVSLFMVAEITETNSSWELFWTAGSTFGRRQWWHGMGFTFLCFACCSLVIYVFLRLGATCGKYWATNVTDDK